MVGRLFKVGVGLVCLGCVAVGVVALVHGQRGGHGSGCGRYVAPGGDDAGRGTRSRPFRTIDRLATSLAGGGTGCVLAGDYRGNVKIERGGTSGEPLVIRGAPGSRLPTLSGIVTVTDAADWVTLEQLAIDGRDPPTNDAVLVKIFGDHVTLRHDDISAGGTRICVQTGDARGHFGIARATSILANRIHGCGNRRTGPTSYPAGHALYLEGDRDTLVRDNVIFDTNFGGTAGGRGIQLWPDSEGARIEQNVVDGSNQWNVIVSGGGGYATGVTRDAVVRDNVLSRPAEHNVTSAWWGTDPQPGVEVEGNCMSGAPGAALAFETWLGKTSYTARDNATVADPGYVDLAQHDYRLADDSPCRGKGPDDSWAQVDRTTPPTVAATPTGDAGITQKG
jgi:hypothetical protein